VRIDHALESGAEIAPHYDSMIAKLIAHAATRDEARAKLAQALDDTVALGMPTNKAFLAAVLRDAAFARGEATTSFLAGRSFPVAEPDDATRALAATLLAEQGGHGEWTGWSNNPAHTLRARFGESEIALEAGKMRADWPLHGDERLRYVVEGEVVHLARGGQSWRLENTLHAPRAKRGAAMTDGRLASPMNGRVVAVNAKLGERIEPGTALVVLEAMKMEHGLALPAAVRVTAVHVAAGAQVAPGRLLVEFEPA
jgi:acetyl/propionyl-CoA carboxylase alpha subunit